MFDSHVVGTTHLEDKTALNKINVGDKLGLLREDDKYDEKKQFCSLQISRKS